MLVIAASSDCVLASKTPTNATPLQWDARSVEMFRSATFADWALAGKDQINPTPLDFAYEMLWNNQAIGRANSAGKVTKRASGISRS
jgi:hypothetical protein